MTMGLLDTGRHAERVFDVVRGGFGLDGNDVVVRSWRRCLDDYLLHPDRPRELQELASSAFEARVSRSASLLDCARHEMATLYQQLADSESAVVLTDTDGVILHMVASSGFAAEVAPLGLRPGVSWSEDAAGTNGMGTCLASASPVAVRREDHFFTRYTGLTCSAVPVFDPSGDLAAVLDVSSRSTLAQQHLLVLLGMTARMIENRLIDQCFRHAHPLHFHSRPEFVYTLHEGRLAVSDDGRVLAANRSALFQLGLQSVADIRNRRIEDIFQTTQDDLLNRSSLSSFHPVVTYRANAAHRFFAVMRRPALEAGSGSGIVVGSLQSSRLAIDGINLELDARNLVLLTLPAVQWEAVHTVADCDEPDITIIDAGAPAVFVSEKLARLPTPATEAVTAYAPANSLALTETLARPEASVVAVP
ncbi:MAG: sigma-54-dependent Fis family transcriptional regulator, partial [Leptothrix sp. (in: b-proteobacteria)]